jgi:hypothetical protein
LPHGYEPAALVGDRAADAGEVGVERRGVVLAAVPVPARRVGLPDLHQRVRHRAAVGVAHLAEDDDPLALRLPRVLGREVRVLHGDELVAEQRAGHLGEPVREEHQRLLRVAQRGRLVAGRIERRVVAGLRLGVLGQGQPAGVGDDEPLF